MAVEGVAAWSVSWVRRGLCWPFTLGSVHRQYIGTSWTSGIGYSYICSKYFSSYCGEGCFLLICALKLSRLGQNFGTVSGASEEQAAHTKPVFIPTRALSECTHLRWRSRSLLVAKPSDRVQPCSLQWCGLVCWRLCLLRYVSTDRLRTRFQNMVSRTAHRMGSSAPSRM